VTAAARARRLCDRSWAGGSTQRYIDLAGVLFRDEAEAEAAEARMFGTPAGSNGANG
jgi:hypothetical protein